MKRNALALTMFSSPKFVPKFFFLVPNFNSTLFLFNFLFLFCYSYSSRLIEKGCGSTFKLYHGLSNCKAIIKTSKVS